ALAGCLREMGKQDEALTLARKALAIYRKALGDDHPSTAQSLRAVGYCLRDRGRYAQALVLARQALALSRKTLGEDPPDTAARYNDVALCLWKLDRRREALLLWQAAAPLYEIARGTAAVSGFDRAHFAGASFTPHAALAVGLAGLGQPLAA